MKITNSIMVGDFSLIKFFGPFDFNLKTRKLEFDFTAIAGELTGRQANGKNKYCRQNRGTDRVVGDARMRTGNTRTG